MALKASAPVTSTAMSPARGNRTAKFDRNVKSFRMQTQWIFWRRIKSIRKSVRQSCLEACSLLEDYNASLILAFPAFLIIYSFILMTTKQKSWGARLVGKNLLLALRAPNRFQKRRVIRDLSTITKGLGAPGSFPKLAQKSPTHQLFLRRVPFHCPYSIGEPFSLW